MTHASSDANDDKQPQTGCPELTCDRCKVRVVEQGLEELFELGEFVQIRIGAGYGARRFQDGDVWEVILCQDCAHELFSPFARLVATEDDWLRDHPGSTSDEGTIFDPTFNSG